MAPSHIKSGHFRFLRFSDVQTLRSEMRQHLRSAVDHFWAWAVRCADYRELIACLQHTGIECASQDDRKHGGVCPFDTLRTIASIFLNGLFFSQNDDSVWVPNHVQDPSIQLNFMRYYGGGGELMGLVFPRFEVERLCFDTIQNLGRKDRRSYAPHLPNPHRTYGDETHK